MSHPIPKRERLRRRTVVTDTVRAFFRARGFLEVDTPVALSAPAPEPHLEAPPVTLRLEGQAAQRYLQTSPELPMKRLVGLGLGDVFQIAPVFRDGELGPRHRPEFRLLEWYRVGASWLALMDDCEALVTSCREALELPTTITYQGLALDLTPPFRRISVDEAFRQHAGFSILEALTPDTLTPELRRLGIAWDASDSWDDLFHRVHLNRVEPALAKTPGPYFLTHYPAPLAALARLSPEDPRVAERFELFAGDLELANAFGELTDATEQRRRFEGDRALRRAAGMNDYPLDERFLTGLETTPPFAGIALGLERLLMLLLDAADIDDVLYLPWSQT